MSDLGDTLRAFAQDKDLHIPQGADVVDLRTRTRMSHFSSDPRKSLRGSRSDDNLVVTALIRFEEGDTSSIDELREQLGREAGLALHLDYADIGDTGRKMLTAVHLVHHMERVRIWENLGLSAQKI